MNYNIRLGVPYIEKIWNDFSKRYQENTLAKDELKLYKKLGKAFKLLSLNPRHNSLCTHEIKILTKTHGHKIWQSYIENKTPAAGRIFWAYGPEKNDITILGIEPHPEDKKRGGYNRVKISNFPA